MPSRKITINTGSLLHASHLLSLFIFGATILSLGPSFQLHAVALLNSSSSNLYQSVYKDAIVGFPSFNDWFFTKQNIPFIFGSLGVVLTLIRTTTVRGAFISLSITSFLFLTILDSWIHLSAQRFNSTALAESIISNLIGAPIFSAIFVVIAYLSQRVKAEAPEHPIATNLISIALPIASGILIALLQYYILALLFSPTPSTVDIKLNPESSITYIIDDKMKRDLEKEEERCACAELPKEEPAFNFLTGEFRGDIQLYGRSKDSQIDWAADTGDSFQLIVNAYDGCLTEKQNDLKADKSKALILKDIKNLSLLPDDNMIQIDSKVKFGNVTLPANSASQVWFSKEEGKFKLTRMSNPEEKLEFWVNNSSLTLEVLYPLLDMEKKENISPQNKNISLTVNGENYKLSFDASKKSESAKTCKVLDISKTASNSVQAKSKTNIVKLRLELERTGTTDTYHFDKRNVMTFRGLSGWYSIAKIEPQKVQDLVTDGIIQGLAFDGEIEYLQLNGTKLKNIKEHSFAVNNARLSGKIDEDGALRFSGPAKWVWIDRKRLSKTRWESLDGATQGVLISLASGILLAFSIGFWKCWSRNDSRLI